MIKTCLARQQRSETVQERLMAGIWRFMVGIPPYLWKKQIERAKHRVRRATGFMSPEHRLVHHFVVREMPRIGGPLPAEMVSRDLNISLERTTEILGDLEKRLTFLYRNEEGQVVWAYPVTVERTPHSITFNTGEHLYAA